MPDTDTAKAIFAVILLIVGFAIAGLLFTFTTVLGGQTYQLVEDDIDAIRSYTNTPTNHTFTSDNVTWVNLGNTSLIDVAIYNESTDYGWEAVTGNYTINVTTGLILLNNVTGYTGDYFLSIPNPMNDTTMFAVYRYDDETIRNAIKSGIMSNFEAQQQIGDYMPIIALAIIITIVIGLIIGGIASKFIGPGGMGGFGGGGGGPGRRPGAGGFI